MIRSRVTMLGVTLEDWKARANPDLLGLPSDRAADAVGFACADYPTGAVVEYEMRSWGDDGYTVDFARWEIVQTGWFHDGEGRRHEKPGAALVRPEGWRDLDDPFFRVQVCEDLVETDNIDLIFAAWQGIIDTGEAWGLQGWFGRHARALIEAGFCRFAEGSVESSE